MQDWKYLAAVRSTFFFKTVVKISFLHLRWRRRIYFMNYIFKRLSLRQSIYIRFSRFTYLRAVCQFFDRQTTLKVKIICIYSLSIRSGHVEKKSVYLTIITCGSGRRSQGWCENYFQTLTLRVGNRKRYLKQKINTYLHDFAEFVPQLFWNH